MNSSKRRLRPSTILFPVILLATWPAWLVAQEGVDLRPTESTDSMASPARGDHSDEDPKAEASLSALPSEPPRFRISDDPEDLVIEFREVPHPRSEGFSPRPRWQVYGDGRFERWPEPDPPRDPPMKIAPEALEALVRSLVVLNDLPAHVSDEPPPDDRSYLRLHLDRYHTADWSIAIDYLDAVVVEDLEAEFDSEPQVGLRASLRELSAVGQWQLWLHPRPTWISGNPHPTICHSDQRLELGLPDSVPPWCVYFRSIRWSHLERDPNAPDVREEVRERLRERLRALPRGIQQEPDPP